MFKWKRNKPKLDTTFRFEVLSVFRFGSCFRCWGLLLLFVLSWTPPPTFKCQPGRFLELSPPELCFLKALDLHFPCCCLICVYTTVSCVCWYISKGRYIAVSKKANLPRNVVFGKKTAPAWSGQSVGCQHNPAADGGFGSFLYWSLSWAHAKWNQLMLPNTHMGIIFQRVGKSRGLDNALLAIEFLVPTQKQGKAQ